MSYSTHPVYCDNGKHPSPLCRAFTPMTQYLITACVNSVITGDVYLNLTDSVCTLNWGGGLMSEMPNWVNWLPGRHDKGLQMIGGAMPPLNLR